MTAARTRLEPSFEAADVRALKEASERDLGIGAELAGEALRAGLVDEVQLFLAPVVAGGGKLALPAGVHLDLTLADERRFESGFVYLRYTVSAH